MSTKMCLVTLRSSDNTTFTVSKEATELSVHIKSLLENDIDEKRDFSLDVCGDILEKIITWIEYHKSAADKPNMDEVSAWNTDFLCMSQGSLFKVIAAAEALGIVSLVRAGCKAVADMIRGQSVETIRATFNIVNDFTPEEEKKIKAETEWYIDVNPGL